MQPKPPTALEDRAGEVRLRSPSAARNSEPILEVLRRVLPPCPSVLEIASGTGEHAVCFARGVDAASWQPSDPDAPSRASIAAWIAHEGAANVLAPIAIDAREGDWPVEREAFDAVVSINMIHIAPWEAALGLFAGAARALKGGGVLFLYGPFRRDGEHTAPSNAAFDASLKARDPSWGVRDIADVERAAGEQGLALNEIVAMPTNNFSLIFARR